MNSTIAIQTSQQTNLVQKRRTKYYNFDILAEEYLKISEQRKKLQELEENLKERLESYVAGINTKSYSSKKFSMIECQRKGNIDYSLIPELKKIDLEHYRKEAIIYWKVIKL